MLSLCTSHVHFNLVAIYDTFVLYRTSAFVLTFSSDTQSLGFSYSSVVLLFYLVSLRDDSLLDTVRQQWHDVLIKY